jgi:exosortase/archaeosortase family protein
MRKKEVESIYKYKNNKSVFIILRYLVILILIFSINIIYFILTPVTVYPVYYSLNLFYKHIYLNGSFNNLSNIIIINSQYHIEIIPACIAGSAYLLLIILNLAVPMNLKKRTYSILSSILILLLLNIIRIFLFSIMYVNNVPYFDFTHKLFWYFLSTLFVIGIWFLIVKIFKITEIPVYNDINFLYKNIKNKK